MGKAEAKEADLGNDRIGGLLFKLALPAILAQVINLLYNLVDRMYIGHIADIGPAALTGLGVTMPVIMCVSAFAALVSMGGAPRASIMMGKGNKDEAEHILGNCTTMLILTAAVLTAVIQLFGRDILMVFGASENTIVYAWAYMQIYSIGTIFVQLALGLNAFINAQGFAATGMLTVVIGAVCNIILDPIFIFAFHMGVRGAALATILSQCVSCVWILRFLTGKKTTLRLQVKNMKLAAATIGPCVALGISPFIMQFTESILNICFNTSLLKYGGDTAVGAMTILSSVMQMSMLPLLLNISAWLRLKSDWGVAGCVISIRTCLPNYFICLPRYFPLLLSRLVMSTKLQNIFLKENRWKKSSPSYRYLCRRR